MKIRYNVTIFETTDAFDHGRERDTWHYFDNLSLAQAWRICERHARRGVNRFGGTINRMNWGARGGVFPNAYRSATIRCDVTN